jgi:hypothetical protein
LVAEAPAVGEVEQERPAGRRLALGLLHRGDRRPEREQESDALARRLERRDLVLLEDGGGDGPVADEVMQRAKEGVLELADLGRVRVSERLGLEQVPDRQQGRVEDGKVRVLEVRLGQVVPERLVCLEEPPGSWSAGEELTAAEL